MTLARIAARPAAAAEAAKQNTRERQQAERLPERDLAQAEDIGQQPIPQPLHHLSAEQDEQYERYRECDANRNAPGYAARDVLGNLLARFVLALHGSPSGSIPHLVEGLLQPFTEVQH